MNTTAGTELPISHNVSDVLVTVTTEVEQTEVTPITAPEKELQMAAFLHRRPCGNGSIFKQSCQGQRQADCRAGLWVWPPAFMGKLEWCAEKTAIDQRAI